MSKDKENFSSEDDFEQQVDENEIYEKEHFEQQVDRSDIYFTEFIIRILSFMVGILILACVVFAILNMN